MGGETVLTIVTAVASVVATIGGIHLIFRPQIAALERLIKMLDDRIERVDSRSEESDKKLEHEVASLKANP